MKALMYKLLSKGLLILVLAALAVGYYYRAELFPQFFADGQPGLAQPQDTPDDGDAPTSADVEVEVEGEADAAPAPVPVPAPPSPEPAAAPAETVAAAAEPVAVEPPPAVSESPAVQWPEPPADSGQSAAVEQDPAMDPLQRARRAYWAGDTEAAVAAYQKAAVARPQDPDVHGELGNIHFAAGNWQDAADAYLAAGRALLARGERAAAEHMVAVLQGLNGDQAASLAEQLAQQQGQRAERE